MSHLVVTTSWLVLFMMVGLLPGCSAPKTSDLTDSVVPDDFSLTIYRRQTDGRHTYLTLDREGVLAYGGGRAAMSRLATPVLTLSPAQRQEVWAIIIHHHLLETASQSFKTAEKVAYDVTIKTSKSFSTKSFRVVDDSVPPALERLHDLLFNWQAQVSYHLPIPTPKP